MSRPLVSIITINYNQVRFTLELLESLKHITYPSVEVIVVDNCSSEDPTQKIQKEHPHVKVIRSEENLGFAGGNNLGIQASEGEYIMFLNNDTEVASNFLEPLVDVFEKFPDAGMASSKLLYFGTDNIIQYAGCKRVNHLTGRDERIGWMERDNGQHDQLRETELAHGAAMMVSRRVIEKAGLMPELFFLYYEEIDWCETIKRHGFKIYFTPESKVYHKESMSVGKNSTLKTYYLTRNRLLYMRRNTRGLRRVAGVLYFLLLALPKNLFTYLRKQEMDHLKAFLRGTSWNMTHLPNGKKLTHFL